MSSNLTTTAPKATQLAAPAFTREQETMIRQAFLNGASDQEAMVLLQVALRLGLDPFRRQIHFVKRPTKVGDKYVDRWSFQVSIQGHRAIAERNPNFAGVDEPKWEIETYTDKQGKTQKHPVSCTVTAWRSDRPRPAVYTARYDEFVQLRDGNPTKMWAEKPFLMLEKCAEANALAKLFPEQQEESEIAKLIADAQIVQAEFAADETAEPAAPQLPGQSEIAKEHLAAILGSESVEQLEAVGNRLAALEIGEGDARYLRDHYKQRLKALGAA